MNPEPKSQHPDMPDWPGRMSRRNWHRHRPPWWPENEPWPPRRRHWRPRHNPFLRRLGCLFAAFNLLTVAALIAVILFILNGLGVVQFSLDQARWIFPVGGIFLAFFIVILVFAGRNLRSVSMPLDDLLHASNQLAEGDYSVRIAEKGPPEVRSLTGAFNTMAARLQGNDEQRRAMLADVSHELRTPLTIIQGNLEGMLDGVYSADEARLKSVLEETRLLSRLIDDLRTLSLAEGGALQLRREQIDLKELVRETLSVFQSQADAGEVKLTVSLPDDPITVDLDPERIRQVLSNLIANAVRYSPRGGEVELNLAESTAGPDRKRRVEVAVRDGGPGISPGDLPHVFDRFYKSADSLGMGLGLPIAKYIVEAHGGDIRVESQPGRGTTISFSLPY